MNTELSNLLFEQRRNALSAYVIHHVMPEKLHASGLNMVTPDHLDRFLMTDTQNTAAVSTSRVAEALACAQTYINSIFNRIEPGYESEFDPALVSFWRQAMSSYPLWAAYQMLEDYPENYIRADLRLDKTQLFKTLENDLGQGKISDGSVQAALLAYLKGYEHQNSIQVISGYMDALAGEQDSQYFPGYAYANSDYYLLGRDAASPAQYYWRKIKVRLDQQSTFIQPDAWSEWQSISLPASNIFQARLVMFCGRLHVVWLSYDEPISLASDSEEQLRPVKLQVAHLGLDNKWSMPEQLWSERLPVKADAESDLQPFRLLAVAIASLRGSEDRLLIAVAIATEVNSAIEYDEKFSVLRDVLKREVDDGKENQKQARHRLFRYFEGSTDLLKFQMRLSSSELTLKAITPGADNNPLMSVQALVEEFVSADGNAGYRLQVRGVSHEISWGFSIRNMLLQVVRWQEGGTSWMSTLVRTNHRGRVEFCVVAESKEPPSTIALLYKGKEVVKLEAHNYSLAQFEYWEAVKELDLTPYMAELITYSPVSIQLGAGFTWRFAGKTLPLANAKNYLTWEFGFGPLREHTLAVGSQKWLGDLVPNGNAVTPWIFYPFDSEVDKTLEVSFENSEKRSTFKLSLANMTGPDFGNVPHIERQSSGTEFLVFEDIGGDNAPLVARLNSQHVADLINRAQASLHAVFAWDAQHQQEPAYIKALATGGYRGWQRAADDPLMTWHDANGLYLRELFFHVPHLIASRLQDEERFEEARRWLKLIFDPGRTQTSTEYPSVDYWSCGWILQDDTQSSGLEHQLIDPHTIALHAPSHYRKAIFMQYAQTLICEADQSYRVQTRDSLANAWLLYRMAADLMGDAPDARPMSTWRPKTPQQLLRDRAAAPVLLQHAGQIVPANLPKQLSTFPWVGVAAHQAFRLPLNQQLLDVWRLLDERFYNLRHFLTIDGAPMHVPLYAPALNPLDLLMARMGGNANLSHLLGYRTVVPPYRLRTMIAKANEVVAALIQFGDQLRSYMELEERTGLEVMQFQQAAELANYTISVQQQLLAQQTKNQEGLEAQQAAVMLRQEHYSRLYEEYMSQGEINVQIVHGIGRSLSTLANSTISAAHFASVVPTIFGTSSGGGKPASGPLMGAGFLLDAGGSAMTIAAELMRETEGYRRRREEYQLQAKLAGKELQVLDKQLQAQQHATLAAQCSLRHSQKVLEQTEQLYAFYQNKSTNVSLYRWLRSQTATLYATLFDVAASFCNSAEACWQFETGNYDSRVIRPPVWQADRHGLNAGAALRLELIRLESEALLRNERHLQVSKTVSLNALLESNLVCKRDGTPLDDWDGVLGELGENGPGELRFTLSESLFNKDYPGQYMRRLHSISVSMPALLGPYQNIRATLTQLDSQLLIKPDIEGVKFLAPSPTEEEPADGRNVRRSLRGGQQICLSGANQDRGRFMGVDADDRYEPFECTGAVSTWMLKFPRHLHQVEVLATLSDIVVQVEYTALYGGQKFEEEVIALDAAREEKWSAGVRV
ncbi:neuraminidase-like domain-containing protein [Pseudomonas putida]|uniref:Tc toxin subunit A-related protein n=1 Tax=Pseudomonas putida TaxID=303 RepID=UPI0039057D23